MKPFKCWIIVGSTNRCVQLAGMWPTRKLAELMFLRRTGIKIHKSGYKAIQALVSPTSTRSDK